MRIFLSFFLSVLSLSAQSSAPEANLPAQPVGPSDLLFVTVYGAPEFTRTLRVSESGRIRFPMLGAPLDANGLMPEELELSIARALEQNQILVDPQVTVTVAEYHSRPVSVAGAVKSPLIFQAMANTTLLEALTRAQGLSEEAGPEILLTHPSRDGRPGFTERIPVRDLIETGDPHWNRTLQGGEEIRVPVAGKVFVMGNVKKPGAFPIGNGQQITVMKALALAEGLAPYARNEAFIYRKEDGSAPVNGSPKEIPIPLRRILDRKTADVALASNDILYIPDHRSRRVTATALERAITFAAGTASGALILGVNR